METYEEVKKLNIKKNMVNTQEWLEQNYPNKKTRTIYLNQQLETEYQNLTQEYKSCEVMIESRVRQKDISERQRHISQDLHALKQALLELKEKNAKLETDK